MSLPGGSGFPFPQRPGGGPAAGMSHQEQQYVKAIEGAGESCAFKSCMAAVMGAGLGAMFGVFTSAMRYDTPLSPTAPEISTLPLRQQLKLGFAETGRAALSTGRNFGTVGFLFSGLECGVSALRAKDDMWNGIWAGAFAGGILARKTGPRGAAVGAGGFALFSVGIEWWLRKGEDEKRFAVE
ncbi:mitochondrial import inner membrane translocase subunit Tim17 family protein [Eremomyces bilateralis CBS 781.70]|uniref:Mitochondrial import inner membrane translocase subunit TIM22 n=1 Tax=Eremomyces bilateralis CBS 781.70 TaxID=1392243 RepID=A0A6G1G2M0_9PEZI|nr:mitochondrial import inner membrane translocase subunit Tim17 family protein [Eremomyces bilateralis CBS 781.70]KAF1812304.1 mitochondrial import inner membrane translocase subunit Tim17 family protein [Eremomyces bilateralis CBS 781.70]